MEHSLLGDTLYMDKEIIENKGIIGEIMAEITSEIDRQALHASCLSFIHPITKREIRIVAPLPKDIKNIIEKNFNRIEMKI